MHLCNNPPCVEGSHLLLGSQRENIQYVASLHRMSAGENRPLAKLTVAQVQEIRRLYARGHITTRAIASQFHVAHSSIWYIVRNRSWKAANKLSKGGR